MFSVAFYILARTRTFYETFCDMCVCMCVSSESKCKVYFLMYIKLFQKLIRGRLATSSTFFVVQNYFLGGTLPSEVAISIEFFCFFGLLR